MNGELPPIDPEIRDQLARRSAGRLPQGLLADVSAAVDAVSMERPARLRLGFAAMGAPRLAAAASLALVFVVAAALVAVPRFMTSPAGTTAYAALTAPELASLLAAKTPPAMNTAIVATVTVDARNDVCPMNRYPTLGVIEGMASQVCVMGADLLAYLDQPPWSSVAPAARVTGTFAFRYLAPGYLGLLGRLTLPTHGIAFRATDDWPLQGKTFLVEGWLGADELMESCLTTPTAGDVLSPNGDDCPYDNWLGTESTAPGIAADHWYAPSAAQPSFDTLALRGNARHVRASGMRIIDGIDNGAPAYGVYVVRSVTSACPYSSPVDSRGCGVWRVLARVSDTSLHAPTVTLSPAPTPSGAYPADRAFTTDELARVLAGPQLAANTALVASVTIDQQPDACPMNSRPTYGVLHGVQPQVCVVGAIGDNQGSVPTGQNVFVFRFLGPGALELLGFVQPASAARLAHAVADDWSQAGKVFMVKGWLGHGVVEPTATHSCDPVAADNCAAPGWLSDVQSPSSNQVKYVVDDEMKAVDSILSHPASFGVYLVTQNAADCPSPAPSGATYCGWRVLARVTNLLQAAASTSPTPAPTATPTDAPPATPIPPTTPVIPQGGSPIGLFGDGNRPLTAGEFSSLWASDPTHLAGRIVVAKGPVPTGFQCWDAGAADNAVPSPGCHIALLDDKYVALDGYWVIRVGADGKLAILGEIATPDRSFVYSFDEAKSLGIHSGKPILVDAWLAWQPSLECDTPPYPSDNPCWGGAATSNLVATQANAYIDGLRVQLGAYNKFGSTDLKTGPIHGIFLIQENGGYTEVLARLEVAVP